MIIRSVLLGMAEICKAIAAWFGQVAIWCEAKYYEVTEAERA